MKINKQQLMDILGVKTDALKQIEKRDTLGLRLDEKGYILVEKTKEGRNNVYEIDKINDTKELLNNITKVMFGTKNDYSFSDYFMYRLFNINKPITKEMLSKWCKVNRKTITRWDEKMLTSNILSKDGYFYIAMDFDINRKPSYRITCKEEYNSYIKCSRFSKKKQEIAQRYKKDEIDYDTMQMLMDSVVAYAQTIEDKFVYRVSKFQLQKNNKLFKDIYNLITDTYESKMFNEYYIDWIKSIK
jgi:hypothetical protein